MSTPVDTNEQTLAFAGGINNVAKETALPDGTVRAMVNLDLQSGIPVLREGRDLLYAAANVHSLWSDELVDFALFVQDNTLMQLLPTEQVFPIRNGLQTREMAYVTAAGKVYHSNGIDTGTVDRAGRTGPWGVPTPPPVFALAPVEGGGLPAGEYRVSCTWFAGNEESGAPVPVTLVLADGQGIAVSGLPQPTEASITALRLYVSPANDPRLFHVRDVAIGITQVAIGSTSRGRLLDTLYLAPMAASQHLLHKNGRIFGSSGRLLRWTETLRYGLYDPVNNYLPMREPITGLASPSDGRLTLYVGTAKKTYLLQGSDVTDMQIAAIVHHGIVPGSIVDLDPDDISFESITYRCPVWLATNGLVYAGTTTGAVVLNQGAAATIYDRAAATFVQQDGRKRFVVGGRGGRRPDLEVTDKVVARVVG